MTLNTEKPRKFRGFLVNEYSISLIGQKVNDFPSVIFQIN